MTDEPQSTPEPSPPTDPPAPTPSPAPSDPPAAAPSEPASAPTEPAAPNGELRPDWLPKGRWDPTKHLDGEGTGVNYQALAEDLAGQYKSVNEKLRSRKDNLKEEVASEYMETLRARDGVPDSVDGYTFQKPHFVADDVDIGIDTENDPLFSWFREIAHDRALTQSEFTELTDKYLEIHMESLPDPKAQMEALGEFADKRIERAERWARQALSEDSYKLLFDMATTSQSIVMVEELMQAAGQPEFRMTADNVPQERLTRGDLTKMMDSDEYRNGTDKQLVARVKAGWAQIAKTSNRAQHLPGRGT